VLAAVRAANELRQPEAALGTASKVAAA
jgi:hypothetical protein